MFQHMGVQTLRITSPVHIAAGAAVVGKTEGEGPLAREFDYSYPDDGVGKANWNEAEAELLARTVWGEARGCGTEQQAAVVWCVLNRVDSERFPDSIAAVVTQPSQFFGYSASNPVS